MTDEYLDLHAQLQEVKDRHREWTDTFKEYYENDADFDRFRIPHNHLRDRAETFIENGIEYRQNHPYDGLYDLNALEFEMLFYGIAAELLLNAIMLKEDWRAYKERARFEHNESPSLTKCKNWLIGDPPDFFGEAERKRVNLVLCLLIEHRNNTVHLGYNREDHLNYRKEVFRVLAFLFDHFFDDSDRPDQLVELIGFYENKMQGEQDYEPVDFDLT